jgi:ABC-type amino acid transport substrate-binding protein
MAALAQIVKSAHAVYNQGMALTKSPISRPRSPVYHLPSLICHFLLVIGHWSLVIGLAACTRPDDTWDRVRAAGVLHVGMDASFPPFETIAADGTLVGFDVDLARELGQRMGVEVQFVANLPYDGLYDALAVGRVDAVISALVVNPSRMADFAYSAPYFDAGQVLVVREWETGIEGLLDLGGRTLAVEFGTQGDLEARKWARRLSGLVVTPYPTAAGALAAVEAGEADAALVDHVSAKSGASGLIIVGAPVVEEPYAVAVHRESRYLLRAIDDALAEMEADGTMETLANEWLGGG